MSKGSKIIECRDCGQTRQMKARGLCQNCYARLQKRGFAPAPVAPKPEFIGDDRLPDAFWLKVEPAESGCWHWTGSINPTNGYARHWAEGRYWLTHRYVYSMLVGELGDLQVDHNCHNLDPTCSGGPCMHRRCVNPAHLRAVTARVNTLAGKGVTAQRARQTHCAEGHPLIDGPHGRGCPLCYKRWRRAYLEKKHGRPLGTFNGWKTHCPAGHPLSGDNVYVWPGAKGSSRQCKTCVRDRERDRRRKRARSSDQR